MQLIKAILTDLDGVVRHWDSDGLRAKEVAFGLESGHLFSICFEKSLLSQAITGQISDDEWRHIVQTKLSRSVSASSAKELVDTWTHSKVQIDREIVKMYRDHFPEAKVIVATNATTRLPLDMKLHHLDGMFDGVLNSSELGVAKPAHGFFNKAMHQLGTRFDEVIYIDDSARNVQSGMQLGICSHHYQNHTQLLRFLANVQKAPNRTST
jgi:putative hydrolase of the HAD superfamily